MNKHVFLEIESSVIIENPNYKEDLAKNSEQIYLKHSDLGIETFEAIMTFAQFAIAVISLPYIIQLIENRKIRVKFKGHDIRGTWREIVEELCKHPDVLSEFSQAIKNEALEVSGEIKYVIKFYSEINKHIEECNDDKQ